MVCGFCNLPASQRPWTPLQGNKALFSQGRPWIPAPWAAPRKRLMSASLKPKSSKKMERNLAHSGHRKSSFPPWLLRTHKVHSDCLSLFSSQLLQVAGSSVTTPILQIWKGVTRLPGHRAPLDGTRPGTQFSVTAAYVLSLGQAARIGSWAVMLRWGLFCSPGDIWLETFLVVTLGGVPSIQVEARNAAKHAEQCM